MEAGPETFAPSLVSRFGHSTTIANFSTFFVLLPVALVFIAIGIPFALRTVAAAFKRELESRELVGGVLALLAIPALLFEARLGGTGLMTFGATASLAYWQLWPALAVRGRRVADWTGALAGASALGLAYYEWSFLGGIEASRFVAPTFLVVCFYAGATGVLLRLPTAVSRARSGTVSSILIVGASVLWLVAPQLRQHGVSAANADALEFRVSAIAGVVLLITSLFARRRA